MELLLGSILTVITLAIANRILKPKVEEASKAKLVYTQSHVYSLIAPLMAQMPAKIIRKDTQATTFLKKTYVRVVIVDNDAYWIKDNALYTAVVIDGMVDKETTRRVDTMSMDKVQLDKTMYVVEKLREGLNNEDSGAGH